MSSCSQAAGSTAAPLITYLHFLQPGHNHATSLPAVWLQVRMGALRGLQSLNLESVALLHDNHIACLSTLTG